METEAILPTKPFGIRGDRLLLFLDIVQSMSYLDESKHTGLGWGGQFSKAAILRLLWDKLGIGEGCEDGFVDFYNDKIGALRFFLGSNVNAIRDIEFYGYPVLFEMGIREPEKCESSTYGWYMVAIFTNVAVGKYTRKDFE